MLLSWGRACVGWIEGCDALVVEYEVLVLSGSSDESNRAMVPTSGLRALLKVELCCVLRDCMFNWRIEEVFEISSIACSTAVINSKIREGKHVSSPSLFELQITLFC